MRISDIMTGEPITIEVPAQRREALRILAKNRKTGVPVVKKGSMRFVGLITRDDILSNPDVTQFALLVDRDVECVHPDDPMERGVEVLLRSGRRHLPVTDDEGDVVGIITPTDLLPVLKKRRVRTPVSSVVNHPCVPVWEETPLSVAFEMMHVARVNALVAVDVEAAITGIVTDRDLFNLSMLKTGTVTSHSGSGEDENPWTWDGIRDVRLSMRSVASVKLPPVPVSQIMTRDPVSVFGRTAVYEAADLMYRNDYGQLPIKDKDGRIRGMCYDIDLLRALQG